MAKVIKGILENNGKNVIHLEQDMYHSSGKNAAKSYEKAISVAIKNEDIDYWQ